MQQVFLIRWMLDHDPSKRPNSRELLMSDYLPPPQVEEAEMRELVRHTLANTQSAAYRYLVDSCLGQEMSVAQDISYDAEVYRDMARPTGAGGRRSLRMMLTAHEHVRRVAEKVFRRHGGIHCQGTTLLPKGKIDRLPGGEPKGSVEVMTRGGRVVRLPFDPRVAFARFVARAKITDMRRYTIGPV
jgi:translation initiation factor 2-alpha kinase 4